MRNGDAFGGAVGVPDEAEHCAGVPLYLRATLLSNAQEEVISTPGLVVAAARRERYSNQNAPVCTLGRYNHIKNE